MLFVVLLSQPCGKERTANGQCQTNLLQLTCAVNVERVTQIWMETIANISQQGLWKKLLAGPLSREFNYCK